MAYSAAMQNILDDQKARVGKPSLTEELWQTRLQIQLFQLLYQA
jgi:hypothetical protein